MALSQDLLNILTCPETKQPLTLAEASVLAGLNARIQAGQLTNRAGSTVTELIDGGLIRKDGHYLYPIRDDIPVMLIDESIPLT